MKTLKKVLWVLRYLLLILAVLVFFLPMVFIRDIEFQFAPVNTLKDSKWHLVEGFKRLQAILKK